MSAVLSNVGGTSQLASTCQLSSEAPVQVNVSAWTLTVNARTVMQVMNARVKLMIPSLFLRFFGSTSHKPIGLFQPLGCKVFKLF